MRRKGLVGWFAEGGLKVSEKDESFVGFEDGLDNLRNKAEKGDAKAKAKIVAHLDKMGGGRGRGRQRRRRRPPAAASTGSPPPPPPGRSRRGA